jgi:hypothetical protein
LYFFRDYHQKLVPPDKNYWWHAWLRSYTQNIDT